MIKVTSIPSRDTIAGSWKSCVAVMCSNCCSSSTDSNFLRKTRLKNVSVQLRVVMSLSMDDWSKILRWRLGGETWERGRVGFGDTGVFSTTCGRVSTTTTVCVPSSIMAGGVGCLAVSSSSSEQHRLVSNISGCRKSGASHVSSTSVHSSSSAQRLLKRSSGIGWPISSTLSGLSKPWW